MKSLGPVLVVALCACDVPAVVQRHEIADRQVTMDAPDTWRRLDAADQLEGYGTTSALRDPADKERWRAMIQRTQLTLSKSFYTGTGGMPTVRVQVRDIAPGVVLNAEWLFRESTQVVTRFAGNAPLVSPIEQMRIDGFPAWRMRLSVRLPEGPMRGSWWVIHRDRQLITIQASAPADEPETTFAEQDNMVESLRLRPAGARQ